MKTKDLRDLSVEALNKQLQASQQEYFNLRLRLTTKQLVNNREVVRVRKDIAQMKTILRERELSATK